MKSGQTQQLSGQVGSRGWNQINNELEEYEIFVILSQQILLHFGLINYSIVLSFGRHDAILRGKACRKPRATYINLLNDEIDII